MHRIGAFFKVWFASGEPWIWMNAGAVAISITAVIGVLGLIAVRGFAHFWPSDLSLLTYTGKDDQLVRVYGELVELDELPIRQYLEAGGTPVGLAPGSETVTRWLVKTGNRRHNPPDFRWVYAHTIQTVATPPDVLVLERLEWGNAYGVASGLWIDDGPPITGDGVLEKLRESLANANDIRVRIDDLEQGVLHHINHQLERLRLEMRGLILAGNTDSARFREIETEVAALNAEYSTHETELRQLYASLDRDRLAITTASGASINVKLADLLHMWQPNTMTNWDKSVHYLGSIWRFLTENPREANTEGGIFPAIFGTVLMVLLMSVMVTPFGVIAAVYLREYAKQGPFVRVIRIAVNNLAGVPSIVYGVFGLGFFVYFLGGNIDRLFFPEALPAPTFGTPGLVWASLTLALLTVPVVIVSTEEGLTRIPRSLREGSLALGATKAETLFRVILPMASPAILTGVILAVARAAGEVAPLMLVGVVKLAPTLPLDGNFPFLHLDRKFMHLGFHIYDVGFQSPNVEAARPIVYATALLLVTLIVVLNLTAITLRGRLERRYKGVES